MACFIDRSFAAFENGYYKIQEKITEKSESEMVIVFSAGFLINNRTIEIGINDVIYSSNLNKR
ncbi:hypothetical protein D8M04_03325 [Oceanobacillus piezotolerans]|uniref:Uncharacterized protein n=1 Tax=Oceanobacillus piezotolerans TaxID=2448030 RepID=A0A498DFK1_9BACI|nr:hypothetical protein D8M04_03325 [Oceanobacillus piezotolerans]